MTRKKAPILILVLVGVLFFSCGRKPQFDQIRAFSDLEKICSFGPRVSESESHLRAGEYIYNSMKATAHACRIQQFTVFDSIFNMERRMFNIIGSYYPEAKTRILLCAHWDSRPFADMETDSSKMRMPILGANDGASGVAVLLEMGRILKEHEPPVGVDIVFFDGEDYGSDEWPGGWLLGSRAFVENMGGYRPRAALLLDMVADADLQIYREAISDQYAPDLNNYLWGIASEIGSTAFIDSVKHTVSDDHIPFLSRGIKTIDIIDFDYPYWHMLSDTPDKCSDESLGEMGRVLIAAIYDERIRDF